MTDTDKQSLNFNAGPAMLPESVLKKIQNDFLDYHHTGSSIVELRYQNSNNTNKSNNSL